jgi:hypothetical protein
VKQRGRRAFTIAYGEILTAERRRVGLLRLHSRIYDDVQLVADRGCGLILEDQMRQRGVRIVDRWGAIIAPTIADFEKALAEKPRTMRQSSDSA